VKKDFNQWQQSWWKIFELTTANPLFFNILPKLLHCSVLPKNNVHKVFEKRLSNKIRLAFFRPKKGQFIAPEIFAD
jgi:hypothetical protein